MALQILGSAKGRGPVHEDDLELFDDEEEASPPSNQRKHVEFVDGDDVEAPGDNERLSAEALALVWFLDGHITFHQFDNPFSRN